MLCHYCVGFIIYILHVLVAYRSVPGRWERYQNDAQIRYLRFEPAADQNRIPTQKVALTSLPVPYSTDI
jgi:hypothetical protein